MKKKEREESIGLGFNEAIVLNVEAHINVGDSGLFLLILTFSQNYDFIILSIKFKAKYFFQNSDLIYNPEV